MSEEQKSELLDARNILQHLTQTIKTDINSYLARIESQTERGYMSLKNCAIYSDLSVKTIRRLISKGQLKAYRPAKGKVLISRKEFDNLIEKSTKPIRSGRGIRR